MKRLRTEAEIMANWKGDINKPVVSVCCVTYNHEDYISDAMDGFLMQETDFPFEIVVRDDCSTDKTAKIIKEYTNKYPNIIKPIYELENQFSKGVRPMPEVYKKAVGEYFALCEGDDYWIDPMKLQKQVNLLQAHSEAVMSVAYTDVYEDSNNNLTFVETYSGNDKTLQGFEEIKKYYFHTSTYVIKADILKKVIKTLSLEKIVPSDSALRYMLITYGLFVLLPEVVSVYRVTGNGIWTGLHKRKQYEFHEASFLGLCRILKGKHKQFQIEALYCLYRDEVHRRRNSGHFLGSVILLPKMYYYRILLKYIR